jgi:uncharacterized protein DUF2630
MEDEKVLDRINELMDEEHRLQQRAHEGLESPDHERLRALEVTLDQCWDLLRQRRAHREFGQDPEEAEVRDPTAVEGYRQ